MGWNPQGVNGPLLKHTKMIPGNTKLSSGTPKQWKMSWGKKESLHLARTHVLKPHEVNKLPAGSGKLPNQVGSETLGMAAL